MTEILLWNMLILINFNKIKYIKIYYQTENHYKAQQQIFSIPSLTLLKNIPKMHEIVGQNICILGQTYALVQFILQQNQQMFSWCQSVRIYNIEKHYHFYSEHNSQPLDPANLIYSRLKTGSISLTTTTNSKRTSRSRCKKGLTLSKELDTISNTNKKSCQKLSAKNPYADRRQSAITDYPVQIKHNEIQHAKLSLLHHPITNKKIKRDGSIIDNMKIKQSSGNPEISVKFMPQSQQLEKQNNSSFTEINNYRELNKLLLNRIYSTQTQNNPKEKCPQTRNIQNLRNTYKNKIDIHQLATSRNFNSKCQTENDIRNSANSFASHSQSQTLKRNHSRFVRKQSSFESEISESQSQQSEEIQQQMQNSFKNEAMYLRILETSRGQARQASIILSNILSRSSENCYESCYKPTQSWVERSSKKRKFNLWQDHDKETILSRQNDENSDCSVKIQQSELYDIDPRNNFIEIKNKSIHASIYSMSLAIEQNIMCLVSLKQIGFREMSLISQELQMYEFLEQRLQGSETYRNILQLYQVQMSSGSYILIKEPYTENLPEYVMTLKSDQKLKLYQQIDCLVKSIFNQFSAYSFYPNRKLTLSDFVVCESVIKIHDLSLFREMNQPIYSIQQIFESLNLPYMKKDTSE